MHALIPVITMAALIVLALLLRYAGTRPRKPLRRVLDEHSADEAARQQPGDDRDE